MPFALIRNDAVFEIFASDPNLGDMFEVVNVGPDVAVSWVRKGSNFVAPPAFETAPAPIPDVSSAQAKIQLSRAGFLPAVKASVEALGGEVEIWFTDARTWQRNNPHVIEVGMGLNLSSAEIDSLFRDAAKINA